MMEDKKRPKPSKEQYLRFKELEKHMEPGEWNAEWMELYDACDWSPELIKEEEKCGLRTALGEEILPVAYDNIKLMESTMVEKGERVVVVQEDKWGVAIADGSGTWLVEPEFDYIGYPNDVTAVKKGDKWGVLNILSGDYLVQAECDMVFESNGFLFLNGIGSYMKDSKLGIITEEGDLTDAIFEGDIIADYDTISSVYDNNTVSKLLEEGVIKEEPSLLRGAAPRFNLWNMNMNTADLFVINVYIDVNYSAEDYAVVKKALKKLQRKTGVLKFRFIKPITIRTLPLHQETLHGK
jgi:hypothetical protein